MIAADPFMMLLALVSLLFTIAAYAKGERWLWGYLLCFIVSIAGAYAVPT